VTATGPSCVAANTAATAAVVLGDDAPAWLIEHGVTARLVGRAGELRTTGGWPRQTVTDHREAS
jgi:thiamine biosynthesis lipoprotein